MLLKERTSWRRDRTLVVSGSCLEASSISIIISEFWNQARLKGLRKPPWWLGVTWIKLNCDDSLWPWWRYHLTAWTHHLMDRCRHGSGEEGSWVCSNRLVQITPVPYVLPRRWRTWARAGNPENLLCSSQCAPVSDCGECSAFNFYIYMRERGWVSLLDADSEVFTKNSCRHSYWHIYDCVSDSVLICFRTLRKVLHN